MRRSRQVGRGLGVLAGLLAGVLGAVAAARAATPAPAPAPVPSPAPAAAPTPPPVPPGVGLTPTAILLAPKPAIVCPQVPLHPSMQVTPKPGTVTLNRRPLVSIKFDFPVDPKALVMQVDLDDVTSGLQVKNGAFVYEPRADLRPGLHQITVQVTPAPGQAWPPIQWCFAQRKFEEMEDLSIGGELSITEDYALKKAGQESPRNKLSGNLHVVGRAAEGDVTATTEWNVRYQHDANPDTFDREPTLAPHGARQAIDVPNFRTVFNYKQHSFELGDITVQETTLTAPSFPRRGIQLKLLHPFWSSEGHFFGARPQVDTTSKHLTGVDDENERVFGGSIAFSPFVADPSLVRLKALYLSGWSRNQGSTNVATASQEQQGSLLSFSGTHASFQNRVRAEGEYVISWADPAVTPGVDNSKVDKAARLRLDLQDAPFQVRETPVQLRLGGEYTFTGIFYRSLTNPGITTDRQGVSADGGAGWGPANVTLNAARLHDNVKDLPQLPRVFTTVRGMAVALAQPNWPTATLSVSRTNQESVGEPFDNLSGTRCGTGPITIRCPQVDNVVNSLSAQVAYTWRFLTANFGFTKTQTLDYARRAPNTNVLGYSAGLALNLFDGRLILSPTFTLTETELLPTDDAIGTKAPANFSSVLTRTMVGTATATGIIIPGELTFDGQWSLTHTSTRPVDGGQAAGVVGAFNLLANRTVTTNAVGRLTWNFERYLWNYGRQALSLRVNWNRVVDSLVLTNDRNDLGVFLVLDIFAPFLF